MLKILHTADWHMGRTFDQFEPDEARKLARDRLSVIHRSGESLLAIVVGRTRVVVASFVYGRPESAQEDVTRGKVARYARGADYHDLLWRRLEALLAWLQGECPGTRGRAVADTAPLLERDFARLATVVMSRVPRMTVSDSQIGISPSKGAQSARS